MIDKKLESYYHERFLMFESKGWKDLIEDIKLMYKASNNIPSIKTNDDLNYKKGELNIMSWILGLEDLTKEAYNQLNSSGVNDNE